MAARVDLSVMATDFITSVQANSVWVRSY